MKEQLVLKPVTINYLSQYDELMRYVFQVTKSFLEESGYEDGELIRSKRPILKGAEVLGFFTKEDRLISSISIYPCKVNIHGKIYEMGGVTGVGTYPEYANMGLMSDLIKETLKAMRNAGQYISYLYPYSIPYYRRKGWEIMSDRISFTVKDTQLPDHKNVSGHIERLNIDNEAVIEIYDIFSSSTHGALMRKKFEWDEYWRWENEEERTAAVYFDRDNNPLGYMFYWVEEDIFHIKEMVYLSQDAYHGIWNFIGAHHSMVDKVKGDIFVNEPLSFLLDDSLIEETIEPYYMARIVDVEKFLEEYPYDDDIQPFHFVVKDPEAEWNNGVFGLREGTDGKIVVVREAVGHAVALDIQTLSTMMMSYKAPAYLYKIGRLKTDTMTLRLLEKIIPGEQPYFSDYF